MRNFSNLKKAAQGRLSEYVRYHRDVSSKDLADDLHLTVQTIAAIKANITRKVDKAFNEALS